MKQSILIIIAILFFASKNYSQNKFEGIVVNEDNSPIPEAVAVYLNGKGVIIESSLVDTSGYFSFPDVDFRTGIIKVTALGHETKEIKEALGGKPTQIVLHPLAFNLDEVVIKGESSVTQKSDRLVFNILNDNLTKGNNSYELLKITPLLHEENNKISIVGKESVLLYINGRKSNLSEEAMQNYLQSLPADNISSVEVITNPGVTFPTSGNQGIINLVLKKNEADGLKGSLRMEDSQSQKKNSQNGSVQFDFQTGKFNLTSSLYADNHNILSKNTTNYYYYNYGKYNSAKNEINYQYPSAGGNLRVDYHLSEKHTLGALLDVYYNDRKINSTTNTIYGTLNTNSIDSIYDSRSRNKSSTGRLSANLNYRAKLSEKGSMFSFDADYLKNNKSEGILNNFYRLPTETLPGNEFNFNQKLESTFDNYSALAEYKHVFNKKHDLTGGVFFYSTKSNSDFYYTYFNDNQYVPDPSKNNNFDYSETFLSGYLSYHWAINDKIAGSAGLKIEYADSKGLQKITGEKTKRSGSDLIPNFSILYQLNVNNRLSYNLSSYARRPGYYSLNPFRFFISPNTYKEYNPDLKTANTYIQDLKYTYKRHYIFDLTHMYISNVTNNFLIPVDGQYIKLLRSNYGTLHLVSFTFSWNSSFFEDRLSVNFTARGDYRRDKGNVETIVIDNKGYSYDCSLYTNFLISKETNWSFNLNGSYRSKTKLAHEDIDNIYYASLGVRKVFPRNISLNFGIRSLLTKFYDVRQKTTTEYKYFISTRDYLQTAYITLSVPFGNQKTKGAKNRRTSSFDTSKRLEE